MVSADIVARAHLRTLVGAQITFRDASGWCAANTMSHVRYDRAARRLRHLRRHRRCPAARVVHGGEGQKVVRRLHKELRVFPTDIRSEGAALLLKLQRLGGGLLPGEWVREGA